MQPGFITTVCEPFTPNATDYIAQVDADDPEVWFKFQSTTSMTNDGASGATFDGTYNTPPVTLNNGPLTNDEASGKALKVIKSASFSQAVVTATAPTGASWIDRGLYAAGTNYSIGDCVYDTNTAGQANWYRAVATSTGQALTDTNYWEPFLPDSAAYPMSLPTRDPWTIELWIKYENDINAFLLDDGSTTLRGDKSSGSLVWGLQWRSGAGGKPAGYRFFMTDFGSLYAQAQDGNGNTIIDMTEWHHIVVTNSGSTSSTNSGTQRLYVDGVLHAERINGTYTASTATGANQTANGLQISFLRHSPGAVNEIKIQGDERMGSLTLDASDVWIDQLAFYGRELSESRVQSHFNAAP